MNPLVSVIIPTFNRSSLIKEALDSALSQNYRPMEIVVIDDGSTDNTEQVVASYGGIKYIRQANSGPAAARNNGIRASSGELIALLDSDDRWLPRKLERQVPLFTDPEIGLVHAAIRFFRDGTGEVLGEMFSGERLDVHDILSHKMLGTQTVVFRRRVFDEIGGFDESLLGPEDFDFFIRVAAHFKMVGMPAVLAEARQHTGNYSAGLDRMFGCQMRVVAKHQTLHADCADCRKALRELDRFYRDAYCRRSFDAARDAFRNGDYRQGIRLRFKGLRRNPAALLQIPGRLFGRGQKAK
jgi:glycosyltransferase involved in cell wall biosynthesis